MTAHAQQRETAIRKADAQIGGGFTTVGSDYDSGRYLGEYINPSQSRYPGFFLYGTFDFTRHLGLEAEFSKANSNDPQGMYEKTYQIGGRYVRHYGRFNPYGRLMYGRGVFNFPRYNPAGVQANLASNMVGLGGGVDIHMVRHINLRADYEYQRWFNFDSNPLQPNALSIGAAYRF